jgi:hypothetical protein
MAEGDTRLRLDVILEALVDIGRLHRDHQGIFTEIDGFGQTFLHRLCHDTSHPAVIKFAADLCGTDVIKATDIGGDTPLNLVCMHEDVSCEAIETLTVPCPEAVRIVCHQGWTPLRAASSNGASVQVVRLLISKFGGALSMKCEDGFTPLSLACARGAARSTNVVNFEVVKLLLESCPEALFIGDNAGNTPLHLTYKNDEASQQVVRLLVDHGGAKALGILNNIGCSPLHIAFYSGFPGDILELMIAIYPKALEIVDWFGATALVAACQSNAPVETLRVMIVRAPATCLFLEAVANEDDEDVNYLPYDCAVEQEREAHVVELLLNATKDAL